jgi:sugar phosphate isomerase/epimerase
LKFAICNELFGDWPWEEGLSMARAIGYTGVEVAPFTLGLNAADISRTTRNDYRTAVADQGMELIGLHWLLAKTEGFHLTTSDVAVRRRTTDYFLHLIDLCKDLGGNLMVLGSPLQRNFPSDQIHSQAMANAIDTLRPIVPVLESAGIAIALEPLGPQEGNFLNHASQAREMIDMIDSPSVRLHLDVKAMSSEGIPIAQVIEQNADIMIHFHANDPNRLGPGMRIASEPEAEIVDQQPVFQALHDIQYRGWVSVEVFDYSPGVETILRESWNNMQSCCQKLV